MSRTNPNKKKPRFARATLLVFGEGMGEGVFLRHLKSLYSRNSGVSVKILSGKGGSPESIVIEASRVEGGFDRKVVVLDGDKSVSEMALGRQEADKRKIELAEHRPCLEAVMLSVLNGGDYSGKGSKWCKSKFESKYLGRKKRDEVSEYGKIFPKTLLDSQRLVLPELNKLIHLMEGF